MKQTWQNLTTVESGNSFCYSLLLCMVYIFYTNIFKSASQYQEDKLQTLELYSQPETN